MDLKRIIRTVPDFPKKGIWFIDITTLLKDGRAYRETIERMADVLREKKIDMVVGPEARGFAFGAPVAYAIGAGFVPVRKKGKLPAETYGVEYGLEYGTDTLEMHKDALMAGMRVAVVDDLLATGGTSKAVCRLIERCGARVEALVFAVELGFLKGRDALEGYDVHTCVKYEKEA